MCWWQLIISILLLLAAPGCRDGRNPFAPKPKIPQSDPIPPTTQIVEETPIPVVRQDRPVKVGALPLVYLLEYPGEIRVVDATAGVVVIGTRAGGRTILAVDEKRGVTIAGKTIRPGPLDPTHEYQIFLIGSQENVNRNVFDRR